MVSFQHRGRPLVAYLSMLLQFDIDRLIADFQHAGEPSCLGPLHTRCPSVNFQATHQWQYKILLLHSVCWACVAQQLVLIFVASRQKHVPHGIELILFLTPDAWY